MKRFVLLLSSVSVVFIGCRGPVDYPSEAQSFCECMIDMEKPLDHEFVTEMNVGICFMESDLIPEELESKEMRQAIENRCPEYLEAYDGFTERMD